MKSDKCGSLRYVVLASPFLTQAVHCTVKGSHRGFYPRDAMLAWVFATATCLSVCLSHAGIVPSRAKAGS